MADPIEQAPPETSIELDRKLRRAAERTRETVAKRGGIPAINDDAWLQAFQQRFPVPSDQVIARIGPEEGDVQPVPEQRRALVVPNRFTAASFDNFTADTPSQRTALKAVQQWVQHARNRNGLMLALIGPTGVGKSHLLYAAANALLGAGYGVYARGWYRLADELRYGGESPLALSRDSRPVALEAHEVRSLLWKQKIVLLDEVRPTAGTAFDDTELAKFACHAYDADLSVLITTNVHPLADVMGPPAASRFTQLVIDGTDRRQA